MSTAAAILDLLKVTWNSCARNWWQQHRPVLPACDCASKFIFSAKKKGGVLGHTCYETPHQEFAGLSPPTTGLATVADSGRDLRVIFLLPKTLFDLCDPKRPTGAPGSPGCHAASQPANHTGLVVMLCRCILSRQLQLHPLATEGLRGMPPFWAFYTSSRRSSIIFQKGDAR